MAIPSSIGAADYNGPPAAADLHEGTPAQQIRVAIPAESAGLRLDLALARLFPQYSRSRLQAWLRSGILQVDGGSPEARRTVWGGERVVLAPPPAAPGASPLAQEIPLTIAYEDRDLMVVDKPAGLVVHPGAGNPDGTLMNALLAHAPGLAGIPRAGIVHRLDKDTSGLLVIAKTLEAQAHLVRQLQARTMGRIYIALASGAVRGSGGFVDAPIGRDAKNRTRMAVSGRGKPARTAFEVLERLPGATLLSCRLESGRTHQIRVHLQSIGHPLVGDPVYRRGKEGLARSAKGLARSATGLARGERALPPGTFRRQALHAARLELQHPRSGKPKRWESPLPADFRTLLESLRRLVNA